MKHLFATATTLLVLAGNISTSQASEEAMAAAGQEIFSRCQSCHTLIPSQNSFGPSLIGVYGRKAASLPRFAYSDALRASGITWSDDTLRQWIAGNDEFVPGTRMRHVAITDQAEQDYLIAFLKSLK